ncbi:hypothetical protein EKO27_g8605 [Xylaria grammica]|uniref:Uncharacterized protein n=1 Tax=Xylaria grammica TaxID=363999 RepID=A0A439CWC3_9PEZI|nr:hypothetical protein EKO27_g8605 [Xylaria grammica]
MRIAVPLIVLGALSAVTASCTRPWNATKAVRPCAKPKRPEPTPVETRRVPVTMKKCMGDDLNKEYFLAAKENLVDWSEEGNALIASSYHAESYPDDRRGVTWYICNCKWFARDTVPRWELDDVQRVLAEECGDWKSGWVWSKKWEKGYNVVPTEWFYDKRTSHLRLCPPLCILIEG